MAKKADVVFCVYNHLVDPIVRESLKLCLKDAVFIFDEAQYEIFINLYFCSNIEDACREAASCEIFIDDLQDLIHHLSKYLLQPSTLPFRAFLKVFY